MKGVKRLTASSYEVNDIIIIMEDDHIFSVRDLLNGRAEIILGNISNADYQKLLMEDSGITTASTISKLPTFRSLSTKRENLKELHRRKYYFDEGVKLKANAQERD